MSDSDEDSLPNNVFTFQNDNTTISANGPNVNNTNITGLSFRNNVLTSTMHMPGKFELQKYGGSNFDHRSMYCRRETSPMSLRSVPDYRQHIFSRSVYHNGIGTRSSMYNGRGGSPMSVRSIDSTTSAADIVFAFKNVKFNKYDLRIIKDAYNKLIKTRQRKRIAKRRNLKLFLKGTRRKSGEDSGEQGSDSSISSDDCRSVRTTIYKENIPRLRQMRSVSQLSANMPQGNSHIKDVSHFGNNIKETPIFMDRTESIKQSSLRNMMPISSSVTNRNINQERFLINTSQDHNLSATKIQITSVMTQKERFKKGFLLPSQRFNKTIPGHNQVNNCDGGIKKPGKNCVNVTKPLETESGSDEEIFKGKSFDQKNTQNIQRKRILETEDCFYSNKKNKSDSPKNFQSSKSLEPNNILSGQSNDFIFAKPKLPIKKANMKKDHVPEKLLAKSRVPPIAEEIDFNFIQNNKEPMMKEHSKEMEDIQSDMMHSHSETSTRPSFIKRKLFTQKLDVAEHKNVSCDSLGVNSPQNFYSASVREKNKARKFFTSQSCLSRDVTNEDNNVLDLIHKIVPPDQINITSTANKIESGSNRCNGVDNNNKWDVTTFIASCDNEDISDTYTDEEIFNVNHGKNNEECNKIVQGSQNLSQCKIVVQKLLPQTVNKIMKNNNSNRVLNKSVGKGKNKKSVTDCVKSFWDTDFESDMEFNVAAPQKHNIQKNQETVPPKRNNDKQDRKNKKIPITKGTILTVRNCHQLISNKSLQSDKSLIGDEKCIEMNNPNSVIQGIDNTKESKSKSKKKEIVKENVPVNSKNEVRRNPKLKQCVDCIREKSKNTPKKSSINTNLTKHDDSSDSKKDVTKNSTKNGNLSRKTTLKSKDCKNSDPKHGIKTTTNKVIKSDQINKAETLKDPINNLRIQPKRKSKDKSFIQSSTFKTINTNAPNKTPKSEDFVCNNTSINNISTIITRSREKSSFNSSQDDYTSINLSNISNRSLRLRQRVQRNIN